MRSIKLAVWYMWKSFINSIKRQWKIFVGIIVGIALVIVAVAVVSSIFDDEADDEAPDAEISEEVEEEPYIPNEQLDFVWDDDGIVFYENGQQYEAGNLVLEIIASYVILFFIIMGIVGGSKNGVSIFTMQDVNFLFPAPMKPQSVLLFKMVCQIGTTLLGSVYIIYQMPNLVNNVGLTISGAVLIVLGYLLLALFSKFVSVFSYVFFSKHERMKKFVGKYGYFFLALPILIAALLHYGFGMGFYASANAVFGSVGSHIIPFWGWLTAYTVYAVAENYLICLLLFALTVAGTALLIWGTWQLECDFYEDAFTNAQVLEDANEQVKNVAAGGMNYGVKHEGKRAEKKWEKRRNKALAFEGYEGASVFFGKTILNRKRMYSMKGLWSPACSFYFWACLGAADFLRFIIKLESPLALVMIPTAICLVCMFFRSFFNPLQTELGQNFIYLIPESPFALLGWGMAGQVLDGAIDLLPMTVVLAIISLNPGYAICCGLLLLSSHIFFGMTALLVDLVISSYLPIYLSRILQLLIRVLPFFPIALAFVLGLFSGSVYVTFIAVILVNVCISLLTFIPSPFFLHKGKR